MVLDYNEVWESMNDLSNTITNYVEISNLLESYNKKQNDEFIKAIIVLLNHYIDKQHQALDVAWDNTVLKAHKEKYENSVISNMMTSGDKVNKWIIPVEDDYTIKFPDDLMSQVGWTDGDTIVWEDNHDGSFTLRKK